MNNPAEIIRRREARYRCPVPDCGGIIAMTIDPPDISRDGDFFLACSTCGGQWTQDGKPRHRIVYVTDVEVTDDE